MKSTDLIGYLFNKWMEATGCGGLNNAVDFAEFAKKFLNENPPVSFNYMQKGNGVVFANGEQVTFMSGDAVEPEYQMYTGEVAVTDTNRTPNMQPSWSQKI